MQGSSVIEPYLEYDSVHGERQIFLKTPLGEQLPYMVNIRKNVCQLFDINMETVTHSFVFPKTAKITSADYFPTKDGDFGIIVSVNDNAETWGYSDYIVSLETKEESPHMFIKNSLAIPNPITCIKTLFTNVDMAENQAKGKSALRLYKVLETWDHIVAIGCGNSYCYIARLQPAGKNPDMPIQEAKDGFKPMNILGCYTKDKINFKYPNTDVFKRFPISAVRVTSLALLPRSRTLLVGLSMGGIIAASLNPSNNMQTVELRQEQAVRYLAPLEPNDDPDKYEYFISASDPSSRRPILIQLWRGSFESNEDRNTRFKDEECYDRPVFHLALEHHILYGQRWINVATLTSDRFTEGGMALNRTKRNTDLDTTGSPQNQSSVLNVSHSFGSHIKRNTVLLAYEKKKIGTMDDEETTVEASVFDLDAYYYKRMPSKVSPDNTVLRQAPILSTIRSNFSGANVTDMMIMTNSSFDVSRFSSSISDADQLFYPSSLNFTRVFIAGTESLRWAKICCIQDNLLNTISQQLGKVIKAPQEASAQLVAAGIVNSRVLNGSPNSSMADVLEATLENDQIVVLNAMIYYGKLEELQKLAMDSTIDKKTKLEIAMWAFSEAADFKKTIADKTAALFQGSTMSLSPLTEDSISQGVRLFHLVHELLKFFAMKLKDEVKLRRLADSIKCLANHTTLVRQFIYWSIVPMHQRFEVQLRQAHDERKTKALRNGSQLPIQVAVRSMNRVAPSEHFWNEMPHHEWYPPTPIDLLELVLNMKIPERTKREIVVQYVVDWIRVDRAKEEMSDVQIAKEALKIMTDLLLGADLEKVLYILDKEKEATSVKKRTFSGPHPAFSMDEDDLSYESLWNPEKCMLRTIEKHDLEKFEHRLKQQLEVGTGRLPMLDDETEMLYQVFLYERGKYSAMSSEAVNSNKLLRAFLPNMVNKGKKSYAEKSEKEREMLKVVKDMFAKNSDRNEQPSTKTAHILEIKDSRKRHMKDSSPPQYVPPTAKKLDWKSKKNEVPPTQESTVLTSTSMNTEDNISLDRINAAIATPARYYRRPLAEALPDQAMLSPTNRKMIPVPTHNSILKTAKSVQSPSRGRIRFHESVPKSSVDDIMMDDENIDEGETRKVTKLNFDDLEEEDEEAEETISRKSVIVTQPSTEDDTVLVEEQQEEDDEEECIEHEKTFEVQEDEQIEEFEVYEDQAADSEEPLADTFVIEDGDENEEALSNETYDIPTRNVMERHVEEAVENNEEKEKEDYKEWNDGIERSFELQQDQDVEPISKIVEEEQTAVSSEAAEEESEDGEPKTSPVVQTVVETTEVIEEQVSTPEDFDERSPDDAEVEVTMEIQDEIDEDGPVAARTRSRTTSYSEDVIPVTPPIPEATSSRKSPSVEIEEKPKPAKRGRTRSVSKTADVQDEPTGEQSLRRSTRSRSNSRSEHIVEPTPKRSRGRPSTKTFEVQSEVEPEVEPVVKKRASRSRTTSRSESTTPFDNVTQPSSGLVKRMSKKAQKVASTDADETKTEEAGLRRSARNTPSRASSVAKTTGSRATTPSRETVTEEAAPSTKRRGRPPKAKETPLRTVPEDAPLSMETPKRTRATSVQTSAKTESVEKRPRSASASRDTKKKSAAMNKTLVDLVEDEELPPSSALRRSTRRPAKP